MELDLNCKIAIEFKINYDVNDYIKDINKLVQITDNNLQKMFCLILTKPDIDKRYKRTIEKFQREVTRIEKIAIFPTEIEAKDIKGELNVLCATWIVKN